MTKDQMAAYLAAFIDGEGHISCTITRRGRFTKAIAFTNTDKQLFDRVVTMGVDLGLNFRTYYKNPRRPAHAPTWIAYLRGGRSSFEKFSQLVPLQCERKKQKLAELLNSYIDREAVYAKQRTSVEVTCQTCTKSFFAFPADLKRGHGKFCSRQCGFIAKRKQEARTCAHCGSLYYVNLARRSTTKFCSQSCFGKSQADRLRLQAKAAAQARWG